MKRMLGRRPSPALVLAMIALLVALGGTAYAVKKINGRNLVNRSVAGLKLKNNTVTGRQVNESTLGTVPSATTVTPVRQRLAFSTATKAANQKRSVTVRCRSGQKAIGGSAAWVLQTSTTATTDAVFITASRPLPAGNGTDNARGWEAHGRTAAGSGLAGERRLMAVVFCVSR